MKKKLILFTVILIMVSSSVFAGDNPSDTLVNKEAGIIKGKVIDFRGVPIEKNVSIKVQILDSRGASRDEIIVTTGKEGRFQINKGENSEIIYSIQAPFHHKLEGKKQVGKELQLDVKLSTNIPGLLFLVPIILGLFVIIRFVLCCGKNIKIASWYVSMSIAIWALIILILTVYFLGLYQIDKLSVYGTSLEIPIFIPIFAFIGVLVYASYSLKFNFKQIFSNGTDYVKGKILMAIAQRVLIAPYLASVMYLIFFKDTDDVRVVSFLSFFTGMYMTVIMESLNELGLRLLPDKARQKVIERKEEQK